MARPGVTFDDIAKAANQLSGQGKNPTIEAVRSILGTGSISTINNHLRNWKASQAQINKIASKDSIPEELIAMVKGLWEKILTISNEKIDEIDKSYSNELSELKEEVSKYKNNNQRWQKMFNQWQQEKLKLENDRLTLEQALEFSQKENNALISKHEGLLKQSNEKQERIEELGRLQKQSQENLEHFRESVRIQHLQEQEKHDRYIQEIQFDLKNKNLQIDNINNKLYETQNKLNKIELIKNNLLEEKEESKNIILNLNLNNEKLKESLLETAQANKSFIQEISNLNNKLEKQTEEFIDSKIKIKLLDQELSDALNIAKNLRNQNELLGQNKWELSQEKSKLEGQLKQLQAII